MANKAWLLAVLFMLLSGCSDDSGAGDEAGDEVPDVDNDGIPDQEDEDNATVPSGPPPAAIHEEGRLFGAQGMVTCDMPSPATCAEYPFTLDGKFNTLITLTMGSPVADYDLFLLDGSGAQIAESINGAGIEDSIERPLKADTYTVRVWAFEDPGTGFTLDITFS